MIGLMQGVLYVFQWWYDQWYGGFVGCCVKFRYFVDDFVLVQIGGGCDKGIVWYGLGIFEGVQLCFVCDLICWFQCYDEVVIWQCLQIDIGQDFVLFGQYVFGGGVVGVGFDVDEELCWGFGCFGCGGYVWCGVFGYFGGRGGVWCVFVGQIGGCGFGCVWGRFGCCWEG